MKRKFVKSSQLKQRLGYYLLKTTEEPIFVSKRNKPFAVIISHDVYEALFETANNVYWAEKANVAMSQKSIPPKDTIEYLKSLV